MLEALLVEREGYVRRGLKDRVAQVDAAIKALGFGVSDDVETADLEAPEVARRGPGRPRRVRD